MDQIQAMPSEREYAGRVPVGDEVRHGPQLPGRKNGVNSPGGGHHCHSSTVEGYICYILLGHFLRDSSVLHRPLLPYVGRVPGGRPTSISFSGRRVRPAARQAPSNPSRRRPAHVLEVVAQGALGLLSVSSIRPRESAPRPQTERPWGAGPKDKAAGAVDAVPRCRYLR